MTAEGGEGSQVASGFRRSLDELRSSLKWLVGAAGAVAGVLVAGLQIADMPSVGEASFWRVGLALASAATALGVVLSMLLASARVLTLPAPTAVELSNREMDAGVLTRGPHIDVTDELVRWVLARRTYLLGGAETVTALHTDGYVRPLQALKELDSGRPTDWRGVVIQPPGTEAERAALRAAAAHARQQLTVVEDAAHYAETERGYRNLFEKRFIGLASLFVLAVLTFAVSAHPGRSGTPVAEPIPARVILLNPALTDLVEQCWDEKLSGVIIGGTLEDPVVALEPTGDCPAAEMKVTDGAVAIPTN